MPNVNRIPFIVEDSKVKYDSFRLMLGFPEKLRELADKEILEKVQKYSGRTNAYPIGEVKVVNNEYYRVEWNITFKNND